MMALGRGAVRAEAKALLALTYPIFVNTVGMVLLVTVDMVMVGRLGARELGAVALANAVSTLIIVLGTVSLMPVTALVSRANGAKDEPEVQKAFGHGVVAAVLMSIPQVGLLLAADWIIPPLLHFKYAGSAAVDPAMIQTATVYTRILAAGTPFGMAYTACAAAMRGVGRVKPIMAIVIVANVINLIGDWILIFGNLGAPRLGVPGCAWATSLTRVGMLACLLAYVVRDAELGRRFPLAAIARVELDRLFKLLSMGVPLGLRELVDRAVFTAATFVVAQVGTTELALNQIAFNMSTTLIMGVVAFGIAGSIRIGRAVGAQRPHEARLTLGTVFSFGSCVSALIAAVVILVPSEVLRLYSNDPALLASGAAVVRWGAVFVFLDSLTSIALQSLVALLDTRWPSLVGISIYWLLSLPLGWLLAFRYQQGAAGMWMGFCAGELLLLVVLTRRCLTKMPAPLPHTEGVGLAPNG